MASLKNSVTCTLIDHFSLMERITIRLGWYGFMIVGTFGIYKQSPAWAAVYVVGALLGFALVVLPGLCAHCPYPPKHATCLFLPPGFINRFYPYKGPQMSTAEKITVFTVMAGMVILPNFWLVSDIPVLLVFWLLGLPTLAAFPAHYCRRCRHFRCPMNKATGFETRQT